MQINAISHDLIYYNSHIAMSYCDYTILEQNALTKKKRKKRILLLWCCTCFEQEIVLC